MRKGKKKSMTHHIVVISSYLLDLLNIKLGSHEPAERYKMYKRSIPTL